MAHISAPTAALVTTTPNLPAASTPSQSTALTAPPGSGASSNNTFTMSASPVRSRRSLADGYKPKMISTIGAKPACLVNASVTYVGDDQIYAFGGFDQFTDEVYNHVLRLNLVTRQWNLVDNYGDIPGVRMGTLGVAACKTAFTFTNLLQATLHVYGKGASYSYLVERTSIASILLMSSYSTSRRRTGPSPSCMASHRVAAPDTRQSSTTTSYTLAAGRRATTAYWTTSATSTSRHGPGRVHGVLCPGSTMPAGSPMAASGSLAE